MRRSLNQGANIFDNRDKDYFNQIQAIRGSSLTRDDNRGRIEGGAMRNNYVMETDEKLFEKAYGEINASN